MAASTIPTLRWGILGCARIVRRAIVGGLRAAEHGELAALASRDGTTARNWASEFGVPNAYKAYTDVLDDPGVDAVYIPLPNELHGPWTMAAADAGKHVLCEKPLALDAGEAAALAEHCRECGVVLMEAFMWRHQPRVAELRRRVAEGLIGELRLVRSSFSFPIDPGDWRLDPARGGGALWDVGGYGVSTARLFAGAEPESARARARFLKAHAGQDHYLLDWSQVWDRHEQRVARLEDPFAAEFSPWSQVPAPASRIPSPLPTHPVDLVARPIRQLSDLLG